MPSKRKQNEARQTKEEGRAESENRGQDCCANFKPKNHLKILISAHAQTLQGNIFASGSEGVVVSFSS